MILFLSLKNINFWLFFSFLNYGDYFLSDREKRRKPHHSPPRLVGLGRVCQNEMAHSLFVFILLKMLKMKRQGFPSHRRGGARGGVVWIP